MYKIGYIDEDKGWRNTFRQYLKEDFEIILFDITADTEQDILVDQVFNQNLDMLVVDFRLDETGLVDFNADTLIDKIQERNLYFPIIILTSHELDALDHVSNANLVNGKDMLDGENPKVEILKQKILKITTDYKNTISESLSKLKELEAKRQAEGLKPDEEDLYVDLNNYIDKTMSAKEHMSRSFYSESTNKKLDELIAKTQELLNKIPDKK